LTFTITADNLRRHCQVRADELRFHRLLHGRAGDAGPALHGPS